MRWRRLGMGCAGLALIGTGLGLASLGGIAFWLRTPPGNTWLRITLVQAVRATMVEGDFQIDALRTDLLYRIELDGVRILGPQGEPLLELDHARARLDLPSLATGPLQVQRLELAGLSVVLDSGPDGAMKLGSLWGPPSDTPSTEPFSLPIDLAVDAVLIEGLAVRQDQALSLSGGVVRGTLASQGPVFDLAGLGLCAHLAVPGPTVLCAEGPVSWDGAFATLTGLAIELPGSQIAAQGRAGAEAMDLGLAVGSLDLGALDPLAGGAGIAGTWGGVLTVKGPLEHLAIGGQLGGIGPSRGALTVDAYARIGDTLGWGGSLGAAELHIEDLLPVVGDPIVLDGDLQLDGQGLGFPDDFDLKLAYQGRANVFTDFQFDALDVLGRLRDGVLTLERAAFLGIAGRLDATGTLDLVDGPLDLRVRGQVIPAELAELGVEGVGGRGTADLRIQGDILHDAGAFRVGGRVEMAPLTYTSDLAFERLEVAVNGQTRGSDLWFTLDVLGEDGTAWGVRMHELEARGIDLRQVDKDLTVFGPARVDSPTLAEVGGFDDVHATWFVSMPDQGPLRAEAAVVLGAFDVQTFLGTGGGADVVVDGDLVRFTASLDDGERAFLRTRGTFDLASSRLEADVLQLAPTARLAWQAEGPVGLTLTEGGVSDASVVLRGLHGDLAVHGDLGTQGALDGRIDVRNLQLDALAELFPDTFGGLSGVLGLQARVGGRAEAATAEGEVALTGLWLDGVTRWLDVEGGFDARDGAVVADLQVGSAGSPLAVLTGRVPVVLDLSAPALDPDGELSATLALRPGDLERLEHVTVEPLGLPAGRVGGVIEASGRLGDPDFLVAGVVETPLGGWEQPARVELDLRRADAAIHGWVSLAEGLVERVRVRADGATRMGEVFAWALQGGPEPDLTDAALYLDEMRVQADVLAFPADSLAQAAGAAVDVKGTVHGTLTARGSPWTPTFDGGIQLDDGSVGGQPVEHAHLRVAPADGGLQLDAALQADRSEVRVTGTVPLAVDLREEASTWSDGALDLAIDGDGAPLALLSLVPGVSEVSGRITAQGTVTGTLAAPVPDLELGIVDGSLVYAPVGLRLTEMNGTVGTSRRRIRISEFSTVTQPLNRIGLVDQGKDSRITLTGAANLDGEGLSGMSARVTLHDAWVMGTYDIGASLRGVVVVSGAWPDLTVRTERDLELVQGRVSYNSANVAAGELQTSSQLTIHRAEGATRTVREEEPPLYAGFDVDVGLDLKRNLEVLAQVPFFDELGAVTSNLTRATVGARLGGGLEVALDPAGNPLLLGEVDVVDGSVQVLRTSFKLDDGRLVFLGGDIGNTQLDLAASTSVQGTPIELRIQGIVDAPTLSTTSAGYDQTQVMLMLLTGRAPGSVAGDQGRAASGEVEALATTAAALVASSVLSGTSAGALTIEPDGAVRVGAPWSASVFTQFIVRPFADPQENRFAGSLDWSLARRLVLALGAGDRFQWSDLSWEIRF